MTLKLKMNLDDVEDEAENEVEDEVEYLEKLKLILKWSQE